MNGSRVAVGSSNPVKLAAVRRVFERLRMSVTIEPVPVESGVRDQPVGDAETIRGATQRARAALEAASADLGIGIEGGVVEEEDGSMRTCAWAAVAAPDGRTGVGGSLALPLPAAVAALVRDGLELGLAMDRVADAVDTKRHAGAVGILTRGLIDRTGAYEVLVSFALAPFLTPEYYGDRQ